ncbi:MAG: TetR family transcriptional regulator [Betaproteobacteria bacterium]|nr:TetR family transcriptional regulator [Betaproteobacteria bacterium]
MSKGEQTRAAILDKAVETASRLGLEGLTIGQLAEASGMSKSGLFAHFGSREELQLAVLRHGEALFAQNVFEPALSAARGVARIRALFRNWLDWTESSELPGGCLMIAAAAEFDDRPGPVRDALARSQRAWIATLRKAVGMAIETGELRADTDTEQFVFEMFGISLATHHHRRLLGEPRARQRALAGLERLIANSSVTKPSAAHTEAGARPARVRAVRARSR